MKSSPTVNEPSQRGRTLFTGGGFSKASTDPRELSARFRIDITTEVAGSDEESSVISAKLVSKLAINARVAGSNPTIDRYFSTALKALGKPSRLV